MYHLMTDLVQVLRPAMTLQGGIRRVTWDPVTETVDPRAPAGQLWCRIAPGRLAPGRAQPTAPSGVVPDRWGSMTCPLVANLRTGDRLRVVKGSLQGTWELRARPTVAQDSSRAHHLMVTVGEVAQGTVPAMPTSVGVGPRHLYSTLVEVLRLPSELTTGVRSGGPVKLADALDPSTLPGQLWCRLSLGYLRAGVDQAVPYATGRVPDRDGVMMCDATPFLRERDLVRVLSGPDRGVFQLAHRPDTAADSIAAQHISVFVQEYSQTLGV